MKPATLLLSLLLVASQAGATSPSKGPIREYLERRDRVMHVVCRILPAARMCRRA